MQYLLQLAYIYVYWRTTRTEASLSTEASAGNVCVCEREEERGWEGEVSAGMERDDGEKREHLKTMYRDRWLLDL